MNQDIDQEQLNWGEATPKLKKMILKTIEEGCEKQLTLNENVNCTFDYITHKVNIEEKNYEAFANYVYSLAREKYLPDISNDQIVFYDEYISMKYLFRAHVDDPQDTTWYYSECNYGIIENNKIIKAFNKNSVEQFIGIFDNTPWEDLTTKEQYDFYQSLQRQLKKYKCSADFSHCKELWLGKRIFEHDIVSVISVENNEPTLHVGEVLIADGHSWAYNSDENSWCLLMPQYEITVIGHAMHN